jgi:5-formyltetrahydrofolate cyclo-ligase
MELAAWRKSQRQALIAQRMAVAEETLACWQSAMDAHLQRVLTRFTTAGAVLAIYWPHRNEYDARAVASRLRTTGVRIALPVVAAPATPLLFRAWEIDSVMATGPQGIPQPQAGPALLPDVLLAPAVGYDLQGYRLGYGGGYFDRTLAALAAQGRPPLTIATAYEMGKLDTLHPQPHDVPMDYVLTEAGLYRRDRETLLLLSPA